VDHVHARHGPAEERHIQQFFFEHIGQRVRHERGHGKRFPGGLVLDQQHRRAGGAGGQVVPPDDVVTDTQNDLATLHRRLQPACAHPVNAGRAGKQRRHQHRQRPGDDGHDHPKQMQDRTDE